MAGCEFDLVMDELGMDVAADSDAVAGGKADTKVAKQDTTKVAKQDNSAGRSKGSGKKAGKGAGSGKKVQCQGCWKWKPIESLPVGHIFVGRTKGP